jgi:hypothetical protein
MTAAGGSGWVPSRALAIVVVIGLIVVACGIVLAVRGSETLRFAGSYNATYSRDSAVSSCTVHNGSLRYRVHPRGETLPEFWVDIPYAGPWQSSYSGKFNNAGMNWGDYAGLVQADGSVNVISETSSSARGTMSIRGYLYYEHPGPVTVTGAWECNIT